MTSDGLWTPPWLRPRSRVGACEFFMENILVVCAHADIRCRRFPIAKGLRLHGKNFCIVPKNFYGDRFHPRSPGSKGDLRWPCDECTNWLCFRGWEYVLSMVVET